MKVKELIERLSEFDPEKDIQVSVVDEWGTDYISVDDATEYGTFVEIDF